LFVTLQVAAVSSAVHHWLHPESATPDHQCVITLVSHGQLHQSLTETGLIAPVASLVMPVCWPYPIFIAVDYRLLPGRAPPSSLT
jgi:hypothetical protein